ELGVHGDDRVRAPRVAGAGSALDVRELHGPAAVAELGGALLHHRGEGGRAVVRDDGVGQYAVGRAVDAAAHPARRVVDDGRVDELERLHVVVDQDPAAGGVLVVADGMVAADGD